MMGGKYIDQGVGSEESGELISLRQFQKLLLVAADGRGGAYKKTVLCWKGTLAVYHEMRGFRVITGREG